MLGQGDLAVTADGTLAVEPDPYDGGALQRTDVWRTSRLQALGWAFLYTARMRSWVTWA